ncbi:hypothetical protein STPH2_3084 [Streptomyces sp. KO7888]|uniref:hypothetical protein n=1 Tax=Streptomyces sp. KO7888 TaxID=2602737 RepID=UPI0013F5BD81|nr:hypothetical protein [Streptomyces sp. KO7888]NHI07720.1 hypothetical protein [Streptomyces sp. KO7888]
MSERRSAKAFFTQRSLIAPPRAFTRAKRQLKDEGFVHERRLQGAGGLWVTQQLVSNVPLSEAEALKLLAQMPVGPAGRSPPSASHRRSSAFGSRAPSIGKTASS